MENTAFLLNCGQYPFDVLVALGPTEFLFEKLKTKMEPDDVQFIIEYYNENPKVKGGRFMMNTKNQSFLHIPDIEINIDFLTNVNHELQHIVFEVHRRIGIELTPESEESFTYLFEFLSRQFYSKIGLKLEVLNN